MISILFVCLGNICRSPIAEATFNEMVQKSGMQEAFLIDSAGTAGYHIGETSDQRTIKNALSHDIKITHLGRKLSEKDLDTFDHIVVMDESNFSDVYQFYYKTKHKAPSAEKLFLLRDYDPNRTSPSVPDPYYESAPAFEEVFQIVSRSNERLFRHLAEKNGLILEELN